MKLEILGMGCPKCRKLAELVQQAVLEMGLGARAAIFKVETIEEIMKHGVMMTPALVIDGVVKAAGRIPSKDEIKKWLGEITAQ